MWLPTNIHEKLPPALMHRSRNEAVHDGEYHGCLWTEQFNRRWLIVFTALFKCRRPMLTHTTWAASMWTFPFLSRWLWRVLAISTTATAALQRYRSDATRHQLTSLKVARPYCLVPAWRRLCCCLCELMRSAELHWSKVKVKKPAHLVQLGWRSCFSLHNYNNYTNHNDSTMCTRAKYFTCTPLTKSDAWILGTISECC